MFEAKIYCVQTTRGAVYALHQLSNGMIWTERTEDAARQLAQEKRCQIVGQEAMSHAQLLRLMGHEPVAPKPVAAGGVMSVQDDGATEHSMQIAHAGPAGAMAVGSIAQNGPTPVEEPRQTISIEARYHWDDEASEEVDAIIIPKAKAASPFSDVFCTQAQLADSLAGGAQFEQLFDASIIETPRPGLA